MSLTSNNHRYVITHCPYDKVVRLAEKRGFTESGINSLWDYCEPCECDESEVEFRWLQAHKIARRAAKGDAFGVVTIEYQQYRRNRSSVESERWETVRIWHIEPA